MSWKPYTASPLELVMRTLQRHADEVGCLLRAEVVRFVIRPDSIVPTRASLSCGVSADELGVERDRFVGGLGVDGFQGGDEFGVGRADTGEVAGVAFD